MNIDMSDLPEAILEGDRWKVDGRLYSIHLSEEDIEKAQEDLIKQIKRFEAIKQEIQNSEMAEILSALHEVQIDSPEQLNHSAWFIEGYKRGKGIE